jgi:hypothetical protein
MGGRTTRQLPRGRGDYTMEINKGRNPENVNAPQRQIH